MAHGSNFRSSYYEKVGCRGVEEKKSLEILLKDKPWDIVKLKQFCVRYTVPSSYRIMLWKVLLDVLPVFPDSHEFVYQQRTEMFENLKHALEVMALVPNDTPKARRILAMWYISSGQQMYHMNVSNVECGFVPIADALLKICDNDVDVYWLARGLHLFAEGFEKDIPKLIDFTKTLLEKEDRELYNYLVEMKVFELLPLAKWFRCCFAGVLDVGSLAKIWDKLCAGASKMLSFVAAILLIALRRNILKMKDTQELLNYINNIHEQSEEVIANRAVELWKDYGCMLPVQNEGLSKK